MKIFLFSMLTVSAILINSSHPVMILILVLTQTLLVCASAWITMKSSWLSFILFIIFLGGLMVLFVYISSLASNEKFSPPSLKTLILIIFLPLLYVIALSTKMYFFMDLKINSNLHKMISPMFTQETLTIIASIMIYLFLVLVVVVKVSNKFEGPLRSTT